MVGQRIPSYEQMPHEEDYIGGYHISSKCTMAYDARQTIDLSWNTGQSGLLRTFEPAGKRILNQELLTLGHLDHEQREEHFTKEGQVEGSSASLRP